MSSEFTILTPYHYPFYDRRRFSRNIGDGIILEAVKRRLGPFSPDRIFSSRQRPTPKQTAAMKQSNAIILAGANQLQDDFSPLPGMTPAQHKRSNYRFVPYGVGIGGKVDNSGASFTAEAIEHLEIMHDRIEYSSWRCPRTVAALRAVLPHRSSQFLMTSCPVALDTPLLDGESFADHDQTVAVTITDYGNFSKREFPFVERIAQLYPNSRKLLIVHSDFLFWLNPVGGDRLPLQWLGGERLRLRQFARSLGYEVIVPKTSQEARALYVDKVDIHFGSRLHAHLLMLSRNKKSHLVFVDERMTGMAEGLEFPLCPADRIDANLDFDFEIVRRAARKANETMKAFENSLAGPVNSTDKLSA
jgi:hypothetical protein